MVYTITFSDGSVWVHGHRAAAQQTIDLLHKQGVIAVDYQSKRIATA